MRIYFDYPLATEENMKAVQDAINAGKDIDELTDLFDEEVLWDCVVVLSGNKDTLWALLDHMNGHEQTSTEVWQSEVIYDYIGNYEFLRSLSDRDEVAIQVHDYIHQDRVLLIQRFSDGGWNYYLVNTNGQILDEGGVYGDENTPLDEAIRELLKEYEIPMNVLITMLPNFRELWDRV